MSPTSFITSTATFTCTSPALYIRSESLFTRRYDRLSARSRGSLTHSRPYRAVHLPPQSQTGGIPVLLQSILFLTLKIKQNKFTKLDRKSTRLNSSHTNLVC